MADRCAMSSSPDALWCATADASPSTSTSCAPPLSTVATTCSEPLDGEGDEVASARVVETFRSFDGTTIAFREWGSEYGTVPVVLHHGFAADSLTNWVTPGVADRIVATGRRVVALDARGHGKSDRPHDVSAYDAGQMAVDVSGLIDHLRLDRIDLVGYSMGGRVALDVACSEPRLRSVVIGGIGGAVLDAAPIDRSAMLDAVDAPEVDDVP